MEETKTGRGGKRPGAGRPKGIKKPYAQIVCSVPLEYSERLRAMAEKKRLIAKQNAAEDNRQLPAALTQKECDSYLQSYHILIILNYEIYSEIDAEKQ